MVDIAFLKGPCCDFRHRAMQFHWRFLLKSEMIWGFQVRDWGFQVRDDLGLPGKPPTPFSFVYVSEQWLGKLLTVDTSF